jgi:hypothetical protein
MAEEKSIKDQIAAMEGWAIKAKQNADAGKYEETNELLRTINTQGRRLEWRGGTSGLKHLPDMEEVKVLKRKVSEARAAAQQAQSSIQHMEKVMGKERKGSSKEEHFARENKKAQYQKEITKSLAILIEVTKKANAIVKDEPWLNPTYLARKDNSKVLLDLFRAKGYYKHIDNPSEIIAKFVLLFKSGFFKGAYLAEANLEGAHLQGAHLQGANLQGADLEGADLAGADFEGANLEWANLQGANLEGAYFGGANLEGADLEGANLEGAHLQGANLEGAYFGGANLEGADLEGAHLQKADLVNANLQRVNLKGADLGGAKGLTKEQLHSAKNWEKAKNVPNDLK